jgi:hypothetical protein
MVILVNIGFLALFIYAAIMTCFLSKRYKELRNYTFWVEQLLLQYRPETYIPEWRKHQRKSDICKKSRRRSSKNYVQTLITAGNKTASIDKLLRDRLRY